MNAWQIAWMTLALISMMMMSMMEVRPRAWAVARAWRLSPPSEMDAWTARRAVFVLSGRRVGGTGATI